MARALLLSVRFHDRRYYGADDWPPAPARLFQALIAGAARGGALAGPDREALAWLETLDAPVIAAPTTRAGQGFRNYMPNNDLDAVSGDPKRIGEIRVPKTIRPRLFDSAIPLLYAWRFETGGTAESHARMICTLAERLYQLGRGVDMAWAWAELADEDEIEPRLENHGGVLHRPSKGGTGMMLLCPQRGSLKSLEDRFRANRQRFSTVRSGKQVQHLFSQPPKPRFASIAYDSSPKRIVYDLRAVTAKAPFAPWPFARTVELVEILRNAAAERLKKTLPEKQALIDRILIGRDATEADKATRVRIVPLPSIGSPNTDPSIRRVMIEIPSNCPIPADDIAWGFSGLDLGIDYGTGEVLRQGRPVLTRTDDRTMLGHYGIDGPVEARLWRTVTPAALPQGAARRRIDPSRLRDRAEWKGGGERLREQNHAAGAVLRSLRHAGLETDVEAVRVQREPFMWRGERAEAFASETRFAKERLWHVELAFTHAVRGPIVIGDGRYLGLGLMAPAKDVQREVMIFSLPPEARVAIAQRAELLHAVRRALMALSRSADGTVPPLFSGHETDGAPAHSGRHQHIFLAGADLDGGGHIERLIVAAPWACDRSIRPRSGDPACFDRVVSSLKVVRAGKLGLVTLDAAAAGDGLFGPSRIWESHTLYRPTRHAGRGKDPAAAVLRDVVAECERRGLPTPEVELRDLVAGPNGGIAARLRLRFAVAVEGPILLGRDSHQGGGLFETA